MSFISSLRSGLGNSFTRIISFRRENVHLSLFVGPLVGGIASFVCYAIGMKLIMVKMAGVASFMVVWWLEGTIRMGLTGLLPIVLLPLLGIANGTKISQIYFSDSVVVCLGSLVVASAVEIYRLHHRAAKFIIKNAKSGGLTAILGAFVFLTGMISMWLSNTATAALMIPLSKAILRQIENQRSCQYSPQAIERAGAAIDLSIAFAASLGGMATLTGTGSNLVLQGVMLSLFGKEGEVTFIDWFILAAPITLFNLFILWIILAALFIWRHGDSTTEINKEYTAVETVTSDEIMDNISNRLKNGDIEMVNNPVLISESDDISLNTNSGTEREENENQIIVKTSQVEEDADELGNLQYPEIVVILVFFAMGALWLTREPPGDWGWANKLDIDDYATDGTVAIGACLILMILPKQPPNCFSCRSGSYSSEPVRVEEENSSQSHGKHKSDVTYTPILSWRAIEQLNWDIIFLLGGGFALSHGFQASGLTASIAQLITTTGPQNLTSLIIISSILSCLCTNVMSNVAAANVLLPSLACVGPRYGQSPLIMLAPVALSISLAFLFPIGTPPNAIILTNKRVTIMVLFQVGLICTVVFLSLILLYCLFIMPYIFPSIRSVSPAIQGHC